MTRSTVRTTLGLLGVPALTAVAGLLARHAWEPRLPEPLAVHWGPEGPDDSASLAGLTAGTLTATGALALAATVLAVVVRRRGHRLTRGTVAFCAWFAALPAAILVATLAGNLDVPTWERATGTGGVLGVLAGVSVAAAGVAALVAGPGVPAARQVPVRPRPASVGLTPGQRAAWVGGTTNPVIALTFLSVALLPALIGWFTGNSVPLAVQLVLAVVAVLGAWSLWRLRVTVDPAGVTIRMGPLGVWRKRVPLDHIASADTSTLSTWSHGGLGVRVNPLTGNVAYKLRGGEALTLGLRDGQQVHITVDRPEQAAGLVNDLLRQAPVCATNADDAR